MSFLTVTLYSPSISSLPFVLLSQTAFIIVQVNTVTPHGKTKHHRLKVLSERQS